MKSTIIALLLAGACSSYAQNITVTDIRNMQKQSTDSTTALLKNKGFLYGGPTVVLQETSIQGNKWIFSLAEGTKKNTVSVITRIPESSGVAIRYETSNQYFYADLVSDLALQRFILAGCKATANDSELIFRNGSDSISVSLNRGDVPQRYAFIFRINSGASTRKTKFNHEATIQQQEEPASPGTELSFEHKKSAPAKKFRSAPVKKYRRTPAKSDR